MDLDPPSPPLVATPAVTPTFTTPVATPPRAIPWLLIAIAFAIGLAVMALAAHYYVRWSSAAQPVAATGPLAPGALAPNAVTPAPAPPGTTIDALSARENELGGRLAVLESRTVAVDEDARAAAGNAGRAEALLIAFSTRRMLDRGQPLGYLEDQLRVRFGARQPVAVGAILQAARTPVTLEDLRAGLDGVAPLLATGAANDGWLASFRREMGSLIVIRHAGTPSMLPNDRLARAHRALDAGQVEAALAEVAHMPGAASADAWIKAARSYVGARQALDLLETAAVQGQASRP
ncbi:MAG: hypothetical protein JWL96_1056 [Sphingomonas bacterium]|uniref:hypothetical protein n=1 Tax=Sphingomonas bacterium TaxID=1895847 RepID=UPI00261D515A|nr:hypothetical protein [Sphingomonas bacterium]MDB5708986.1 hypothetical protein [Sphingomonas bacterium]